MVGDHELYVRVLLHHAHEGRDPGVRVGIGGGVDLLVDDLDAGLLERVHDTDGALAPVAALALEAPDEGFVAALQPGSLDRLLGQRVARVVVRRADEAEPFRGIFPLGVRERGVERGEDVPLREVWSTSGSVAGSPPKP